MTSQLPVEHWHEAVGDPTLADAILDRLVHNAHRLNLTGESMRSTTPDQKLLTTPVRTDPMFASASLPTIVKWLPTMA